jgi:uncharacterized protein with PQ loop repeat
MAKMVKSRTNQLELKMLLMCASAICCLFIIGIVLAVDMYKPNDKTPRRD